MIPLYMCLMQASAANHVPAEVVVSVISVEGGRHGIAVENKNKTQDLGVMQINTGAWLPLISKTFFKNDVNAAYDALKDNDCFNIQVGTWILARSIRLESGDLWRGVGRYHSNTPELKIAYMQRVKKKHDQLFIISKQR